VPPSSASSSQAADLFTPNVESQRSSETSVTNCQSARRNISKDSNLNHRHIFNGYSTFTVFISFRFHYININIIPQFQTKHGILLFELQAAVVLRHLAGLSEAGKP
jgi:hypothetical protein